VFFVVVLAISMTPKLFMVAVRVGGVHMHVEVEVEVQVGWCSAFGRF
jgi:hypothetical protein